MARRGRRGLTLADFTAPDLILPRLRGRDASGVIQELSEVLARAGRVPDFLPFYQAVLNREFLVSTDMEAGMAFPHARLLEAEELVFALGRSDEALRWGGRTAPSVRLVFLLAVPENGTTPYLQLISGLARLSRQPASMDALLSAPEAPQLMAALGQMTVGGPAVKS